MRLGPRAVANGYGRMVVSGSTRYSTPKGKRLRTFGRVYAGGMAGSIGGMAAGRTIGHLAGGHTGAAIGGVAGSVAGGELGRAAGRHSAVKAGLTTRSKQRMSVRGYHAIFHNTHQNVARHM